MDDRRPPIRRGMSTCKVLSCRMKFFPLRFLFSPCPVPFLSDTPRDKWVAWWLSYVSIFGRRWLGWICIYMGFRSCLCSWRSFLTRFWLIPLLLLLFRLSLPKSVFDFLSFIWISSHHEVTTVGSSYVEDCIASARVSVKKGASFSFAARNRREVFKEYQRYCSLLSSLVCLTLQSHA